MDKLSIFKDKSVIWAVVLLVVVIVFLQYIQSNRPAGARASFFGTYTSNDTTAPIISPTVPSITFPTNNTIIPTPIDTGEDTSYYCNTCGATTRDGVKTWFCEKTKFSSPCENRCESADDCGSSGGSGDGGGSDGGGTAPDGGGDKPTTPKPTDPNNDGKHKECIPVIYGTTTYKCDYVDGEGPDTCPSSTACKGEPANYYLTCEGTKCVRHEGAGRSNCSSDLSCSKYDPSGAQNQSTGGFWTRLWRSILSFFARW